MATAVDHLHLITAEQFLDIDFGEQKAELEDGVIRMMGGGSFEHAKLQRNVFGALFMKLRGSKCQPYGPDIAVQTTARSVRYPDVSVYCDKEDEAFDSLTALQDPKLLVEILSESTKRTDDRKKLPEYTALRSVDAVLFVAARGERLRLVTRIDEEGWSDRWLKSDEDVVLPTLGITLTRAEIFAR